MRRNHVRTIALVLAVLSGVAGAAFAAEGSGKLKVQIPPAPELYGEVQPLTVAQCGQCHPSLFRDLKDNGGKHRFDCQKCHTAFHAYNPKKANYDALMPKCANCHADPHGPKVTDCASCHTNPHTPKKVGMSARLNAGCIECHPGPQQQLTANKSKHTTVACSRCHTAHGLIPSCMNCHKPHFEGQELAACKACHPVHKPLEITYQKDTQPNTCAACHDDIYGTWKKTPSKHASVNCAACHHTKHGYIPQCTECHPAPHKKEILARFPKCLDCHIDAHNPPTNEKK